MLDSSLFAQVRAERARRRIDAERLSLAQDDNSIRERCKTLYGFLQEFWHVLEPTTRFVGGWDVEAICDHLQAVSEGRIRRLLINIPPGWAKSLIVAVFWPAWEWGPCGRASERYLAASYEETLAIRDNERMRKLITDEDYQRLWPDLKLSKTENAKTRFANTQTGVRESRAFTSLTGGRGSRVIIDDPHSVKIAESDQQRGEVIKIFLESVPHRLDNLETDAIIVVMQRLHENDVSGVILSRGLGYVHLRLPMEFEIEKRCETEIGFRDPRTYEGELLNSQRVGPAAVATLKKSLGEYATAGQLQQRPSPREGALIKVGLIEVVRRDQVPSTIIKRARAWDFAATKVAPGKDPDWTRGLRMERCADGYFWITGLVSARDGADKVQKLVKATASQDGQAVRIHIPQDPGQAGKAQAAAYVRALAGYTVVAEPVTGDKETRALPFASQVEAGNVRVVDEISEEVLGELRTFPAGAHDDIVDAVADAFNEIAEIKSSEGLAEFYRQEAAKAEAEARGETIEPADDEMVRIMPPAGISVAYGIDGLPYFPGADGSMLVKPIDAGPLLSQMGWVRVHAEAA